MNVEKNSSVAVNAILSFVKTLTGIIFPIITFAYASRILGADGVGKVTFSRNVITYFTTLATFGVNYYGTREVAKRRDNKEELSKFCHEMLMINGIGCVISYVLLTFSLILITKFNNYQLLLVVNSVSIILTCLGMDWLYQGLEKFKFITIRTICFQFISIVYMLLFVRSRTDILAYTVVLIFSSSGAFALNFINSRCLISYKRSRNYDIKGHLKPMLRLFAFAISVELYTVLDSTMLGFLKGDNAVGLYTVAVKTNKMTDTLVTSLGVVLIPRLAYYLCHGAEKKSRELINKAYNYIFLFSVPLCVGVFILAKEIIYLFSGEDFLSATLTMRLLVPIVVIIPFNVLTNIQIFIPMGKENLVLLSSILAALVNFMVNYILIPPFSQNGAAIGTVVAEGTCAVMCFIFSRKYIGIKGVFRLNYQYWLASLPILGIGYLTSRWINGIVLRVAVTVFLSVIIYTGILYAFKNPYFEYVLKFAKEKLMRK